MTVKLRNTQPYSAERVGEVAKRLFDQLTEKEREDPNVFLNVLGTMLATQVVNDYADSQEQALAIIDRFSEMVKTRILEK